MFLTVLSAFFLIIVNVLFSFQLRFLLIIPVSVAFLLRSVSLFPQPFPFSVFLLKLVTLSMHHVLLDNTLTNTLFNNQRPSSVPFSPMLNSHFKVVSSRTRLSIVQLVLLLILPSHRLNTTVSKRISTRLVSAGSTRSSWMLLKSIRQNMVTA